MRRALWLVVMVACAARPQHRIVSLEPEGETAKDTPAPSAMPMSRLSPVSRPGIDVGLDEILQATEPDRRWPLTRAPSLEPHYPLITAFYGALDPWSMLCDARRAVRKSSAALEVGRYLEAWCHLQAREIEAGLGGLADVATSSAIGEAARADIIDALADARDSAFALHWLRDHHLETIAMLDALATTYLELGRADDARRVGDVVFDRDRTAGAATRCRRLAREMRMVLGDTRDKLHEQINVLAAQQAGVCETLAAELQCPLIANQPVTDVDDASTRCKKVLTALAIGEPQVRLVATWQSWPRDQATFEQWWTVALNANGSRPQRGSDELMTAALQNATLESGCEPTRLGNIRMLAIAVRGTTDHPREIDPALDLLADLDPKSCKSFTANN
jgi:hypothetical protein